MKGSASTAPKGCGVRRVQPGRYVAGGLRRAKPPSKRQGVGTRARLPANVYPARAKWRRVEPPAPRSGIDLTVIGHVRSPYATPLDAPRQGFLGTEESVLDIDAAFVPALEGLDDGQDILVLFWGHMSNRDFVQSPGGTGAFAGRHLHRPNPIGISRATIIARDGNRVRVLGLDAVDGSPIIDLKPAREEWEGTMPMIGLDMEALSEVVRSTVEPRAGASPPGGAAK